MKITQIYQICKNKKCPKFNSDILNCPFIDTCKYKNIFLIGDTNNQELDGKEHGTWIWWYENGQKEYETNYKNGKKHGKMIGWHGNGQKAWEDEYKDGKEHGKWTWWNDNGQKNYEGEYKNGKSIKVKYFDENENEII